ncbi:unnamed protein product [Trichogramma brassicae]|uniref:Ionotropic glutamate receptor C-terminal domain-containing protein n=1 Tax=Trichogramma brassicae TaxID=86971 RepID=A0A6H5IY52_9HYME|nr:unnamed protein product [Trichogramma brassicae]
MFLRDMPARRRTKLTYIFVAFTPWSRYRAQQVAVDARYRKLARTPYAVLSPPMLFAITLIIPFYDTESYIRYYNDEKLKRPHGNALNTDVLSQAEYVEALAKELEKEEAERARAAELLSFHEKPSILIHTRRLMNSVGDRFYVNGRFLTYITQSYQYEVVVSVDVEEPALFTTGSSRVEEVVEVYPMIISMILTHINANHTLLVYPIMTKYDRDKKPQGTVKAAVDGEVDIDARLKAITDQWQMQTNVVRGSHLLILSRKVEVSGTKKFASALSMQIIVILVFAFGMFVAVSRLLLKLSWSNIYFEFIRTFTNAMQDRAFDKSTYFSERIVMIILILLTSGSSTYLLTLLSALNTVPDFEPIVETPRDLQHYPNMKLYAFASLPQELADLVVSKIYQFDDLLDCVDKIKKNDHRVCICGFMMLGKCGIVETNVIHISRPVTTTRTSVSFQVRPDWPLLPRANWIIRRLFDSGITMQYVKMCHKLPDPNDEDADPTSNDDLHFSFLLLLGGCFMELNNAAAALSWWLRLRQEPRMTPPVADEGAEAKYYYGNQQEAAAAGRMGRNLDPIGGGNLVRRNLDSIGGGNLIRRNLDSIGGGNLLRSVQQTPPSSRFEPTGGRGILRERHLSGRAGATERQSGEAALRRDRPQRLQHVQAQHRRDRSDGLQRLQAQPRRDRPHGLQRVQAQLRRDRSGRLRRLRRQAQHRRDRSRRLRRLQSQAQLRRDRPQRRARIRQEVRPEEQQSQQQQAPSLKSSDHRNKISSNSSLPPEKVSTLR